MRRKPNNKIAIALKPSQLADLENGVLSEETLHAFIRTTNTALLDYAKRGSQLTTEKLTATFKYQQEQKLPDDPRVADYLVSLLSEKNKSMGGPKKDPLAADQEALKLVNEVLNVMDDRSISKSAALDEAAEN